MYYRDVEDYMGYCTRRGLSRKTIWSYEQSLRLFGEYLSAQGITRTEDIRHIDIARYIDDTSKRGKYTVSAAHTELNYPQNRTDYGKQISNVTINNYLRNLGAFFNWCVEEEIIRKSPVRAEDKIKTTRTPLEFVSDEDFKNLLACLDISKFSEYRDSIVIQLLLDTGMRIGECLALEVCDVDFAKGWIFLKAQNTKGKADRRVFFSDRMGRKLKRWVRYQDRMRDTDYLFSTNQGHQLEVRGFEQNLRKYCKRVGLKGVHPHCFRNNFAKRFLMSGGDIFVLSRILGHSSVTVTEQAYLDVTDSDLQSMYKGHSPIENIL